MKKFLCYDTNDAASGKINVDSRGMLKPNSTVPSGSTPYQQLVTDGDGNTKWEDRLCYSEETTCEIMDTALSGWMGPQDDVYFLWDVPVVSLPTLGVTYTVLWGGSFYEVKCVESTNGLGKKFYDFGSDSFEYPFYISIDEADMTAQVSTNQSRVDSVKISGLAITTVPIDEKFIPTITSLFLKASTASSTKKFKITVDDRGTISATEVTS